MNVRGPLQTAYAPLFRSTTNSAGITLGTRIETRDGRVFRWALAGGTTLVTGNVLQSPVQITNHQNLTPVAAAIGDKLITVALGATLATANQYAGGWAMIDTTPSLGFAYPIASHAAAALSTSVDLILPSDAPVQVALTTSSRVSLQANPYSGVIQFPTTATGAYAGVCVYPITNAEYGWIQTGGPACVLVAGTPAVGQLVSPSTGTAGAAMINSGTIDAIGTMLMTGQSGLCQAVMLIER